MIKPTKKSFIVRLPSGTVARFADRAAARRFRKLCTSQLNHVRIGS